LEIQVFFYTQIVNQTAILLADPIVLTKS